MLLLLLLLLLPPLYSQLTHAVIISMRLGSTIRMQYNSRRLNCTGSQSLFRQAARESESLLGRREQN